jgi:hypothetical protein
MAAARLTGISLPIQHFGGNNEGHEDGAAITANPIAGSPHAAET